MTTTIYRQFKDNLIDYINKDLTKKYEIKLKTGQTAKFKFYIVEEDGLPCMFPFYRMNLDDNDYLPLIKPLKAEYLIEYGKFLIAKNDEGLKEIYISYIFEALYPYFTLKKSEIRKQIKNQVE